MGDNATSATAVGRAGQSLTDVQLDVIAIAPCLCFFLRRRLLLTLVAILSRRRSRETGEHPGEVVGIGETDAATDLLDGFAARFEKALCLLDAITVQVF